MCAAVVMIGAFAFIDAGNTSSANEVERNIRLGLLPSEGRAWVDRGRSVSRRRTGATRERPQMRQRRPGAPLPSTS